MGPNDSKTRPGPTVGRRDPRPRVAPFALWCQIFNIARSSLGIVRASEVTFAKP
jgi:hypothetical protein